VARISRRRFGQSQACRVVAIGTGHAITLLTAQRRARRRSRLPGHRDGDRGAGGCCPYDSCAQAKVA
jgi:hypothetical protein